jgi:hypothetical protein
VDETAKWIDDFVGGRTVDRAYLIGPIAARDEILGQAVRKSKVAGSLMDLEDPGGVVALGTAILAKSRMEGQETDCLEPSWCDKIRREADNIAGATYMGHSEL